MSSVATVTRAELEAQGRDIVGSLGGKWSGQGGMCRCPAHADGSPSLSVRIGETTLLFHCFAGCATIDVLRALRATGVGPGGIKTSHERQAFEPNTLQPLVERLWSETRPLTGSLAARYLLSRGLTSHSAQLRFHPRVQLGSKSEATHHPALIAAVRDDSGLVAVHRTVLDPVTAGKAAMDNPKRLLGNPGSGAVRLGTATRILGLAEGIETAIAASMIAGIPVWAVLGNERFGMITIPPHVEKLVILADNDAGGERAAKLAQDGLQRDGLEMVTVWPLAPHNDWADVLKARGATVSKCKLWRVTDGFFFERLYGFNAAALGWLAD